MTDEALGATADKFSEASNLAALVTSARNLLDHLTRSGQHSCGDMLRLALEPYEKAEAAK